MYCPNHKVRLIFFLFYDIPHHMPTFFYAILTPFNCGRHLWTAPKCVLVVLIMTSLLTSPQQQAGQARPCWTESIRHINLIYWHRSEFWRGNRRSWSTSYFHGIHPTRGGSGLPDRYNHQNISHGASFEHFSLARFGLLQGKAAVAAVVTAAAAPCGRCWGERFFKVEWRSCLAWESWRWHLDS